MNIDCVSPHIAGLEEVQLPFKMLDFLTKILRQRTCYEINIVSIFSEFVDVLLRALDYLNLFPHILVLKGFLYDKLITLWQVLFEPILGAVFKFHIKVWNSFVKEFNNRFCCVNDYVVEVNSYFHLTPPYTYLQRRRKRVLDTRIQDT